MNLAELVVPARCIALTLEFHLGFPTVSGTHYSFTRELFSRLLCLTLILLSKPYTIFNITSDVESLYVVWAW